MKEFLLHFIAPGLLGESRHKSAINWPLSESASKGTGRVSPAGVAATPLSPPPAPHSWPLTASPAPASPLKKIRSRLRQSGCLIPRRNMHDIRQQRGPVSLIDLLQVTPPLGCEAEAHKQTGRQRGNIWLRRAGGKVPGRWMHPTSKARARDSWGAGGGQLQACSPEEDKGVASLPTVMDLEQKIKYF